MGRLLVNAVYLLCTHRASISVQIECLKYVKKTVKVFKNHSSPIWISSWSKEFALKIEDKRLAKIGTLKHI